MVMGQVFSGTRSVPPLMEQGLILINGFGMDLRIFLKTRDGFGYCLTSPQLYIKLNFLFYYF